MRRRRKNELEPSAPAISEDLLDIARQIHERVEQWTAQQSADAFDMDDITRNVEDGLRFQAMRDMYGNLPPAQRLELLHRLFGDAALRQGLEEERARELRAGMKARALEALREDSERGVFDLRKVPLGSLVECKLFRASDFVSSSDPADFADPSSRYQADLTIKGLRDDKNGLTIIKSSLWGGDKRHAAHKKSLPLLRVQLSAAIGSQGSSGRIEPVLYWDSPVFTETEAGLKEIRLLDSNDEGLAVLLGCVRVDNAVILPQRHAYEDNVFGEIEDY